MWFWFAVIALLCWSGSDLFSKIGCRDSDDKNSYLKMVFAVGIVMGLHAAYELIFNGVELSGRIVLTYLPVSLLYILSMAIGYLGLRFIELSISSPICNSSGAIVAILVIATGGLEGSYSILALIAVALVCIGVIGLGITEAREDDDLRRKRQEASNYFYSKSAIAIIIPVIYCLLDALGTFADAKVLEIIDEDSANVAYELTFLAVGLICGIYVFLIKKEKPMPRRGIPRFVGAAFETVGQFFYIYALADSRHVAYSAPIISSYCVVSVLWGRLFLKEKLSWKHYICIIMVFIAIVILGILDI
ncbi:MAG: DMT family transporter [Oscillospiraceae bacterium]|nr:DMT family transporter [Oscillospiraceae bacterium]